jgi:hypothetical protein
VVTQCNMREFIHMIYNILTLTVHESWIRSFLKTTKCIFHLREFHFQSSHHLHTASVMYRPSTETVLRVWTSRPRFRACSAVSHFKICVLYSDSMLYGLYRMDCQKSDQFLQAELLLVLEGKGTGELRIQSERRQKRRKIGFLPQR